MQILCLNIPLFKAEEEKENTLELKAVLTVSSNRATDALSSTKQQQKKEQQRRRRQQQQQQRQQQHWCTAAPTLARKARKSLKHVSRTQ